MRNKLGLQVFGLSSLRAWWCACAHARVLGLVRVHYRTRRLEEWTARESLKPPSAGQMPGIGRKFYRTFDEGCHGALGQRRPRAPASGRRSSLGRIFGHGPRWIAALGGPPASGAPPIHAVPSARACAPFPCACKDDGCSRARLRP